MATVFTDFFPGANGAAWDSTKWTMYNSGVTPLPTATIDAERGKLVVPASASKFLVAKATHAAVGDIAEILVRYTRGAGTTQYATQIGVMYTGTSATLEGTTVAHAKGTSGAWVRLNGADASTGHLLVIKPANGVTVITLAVTGVSIALGATRLVRLRAETAVGGTTSGRISLKVWDPAVAEPTAWNQIWNVTNITNTALPQGVAHVGVVTNSTAPTTQNVFLDNLASGDMDVNAGINVNIVETPATASALAPDSGLGFGPVFTTTPGTSNVFMPDPAVTTIKSPTFVTTPATSSALMVDPVVSGQRMFVFNAGVASGSAFAPDSTVNAEAPKTFITTPATASAEAGNALRESSFTSVAVIQDVSLATSAAGAEGMLLLDDNGGTPSALLKYATPMGKENIFIASLRFTPSFISLSATTANDVGIDIYAITTPWDEATVTLATAPTMVLVDTQVVTLMKDQPAVIDISKSLSGNHGVALRRVAGGDPNQFYSKEGALPPSVNVTYEAKPISVAFTTSAALGNLSLPDPTVTIVIQSEVTTGPGTANAAMVDPLVTTQTVPSVNFLAAPFTASAVMTDGMFTVFVDQAAQVMTAEGEIRMPTVTTEQNAAIFASALTATATLVPVLEENTLDTWYARLALQTDANDIWLRLNELTGTVAKNEKGLNGTFVGLPVLGKFGLENRRGVDFDGIDDGIEFPYKPNLSRNGAIEIVFKTTDADGTLMYGAGDASPGAAGTFFGLGYQIITNVTLAAGKIRVNTQQFSSTSLLFFEGGTRVDDDQWHHVVVTWVNTQLQVFLDGKLHFQRQLPDSRLSLIGAPTAIGKDFRGEIMEFVFRAENVLVAHDVQQNYYAAYGITPIPGQPMLASATATPLTKGRGNQKRALGLYYYETWDEGRTIANYTDTYNWTGISIGTDSIGLNVNTPFDMNGYKVFPKSVQTGTGSPYLGGAYFDALTGERRYIDVSKDVDVEDYDMVFFINYPPRFNFASGFGDEPSYLSKLFEDMVTGVRNAVDKGVSLWVPQPEIAVALGVVDRVENHSMLRESIVTEDQGNAAGFFDARGAAINPWAGGETTQAKYYYDTHSLNRQRIVAKIDGLTSLGGYILEDYFYGRPRDPFKVPFEAWDYKEVPTGLQIGDEMFYNQDYYSVLNSSSSSQAYNRRRNVISVPPANVLSGTVIARENATHYVGSLQVENAFKDYATTIVLQPGDTLKGTPIGGKIFVNFMDSVDSTVVFRKQIVPPNNLIPEASRHEGEDKRKWDYASFRVNKTSQSLGTGGTVSGGVIILPEGGQGGSNSSFNELIGSLQNGSGNLVSIQESEQYPVEFLQHISMIDRGLMWLSDRVIKEPGSVTVRTSAMTATATALDPALDVQTSTEFRAGAMYAIAGIIKPANVIDPNVELSFLPMTATATITGYGKTVSPAPMTASALIVENFEMVMAGGEQVVVYLHHTDANVYILEEE